MQLVHSEPEGAGGEKKSGSKPYSPPAPTKKPWLFLLIPVIVLAAWLILWALGGILVIADPLTASDAVVPLSGGDRARVEEAARIFLDGYAKLVIVTDTGGYVPEWDLFTTDSVRFELIGLGVPENFIRVTEHIVASTADEARATRKLMNQANLKSLIVVTDPFHSFRTRLIFREVYRNTDISIVVRPAPGHWYRSNTWFLSLEGWRTTLQEYLKIAAYALGRISLFSP